MEFNAANLENKLSQITETQDSISSIAQWILLRKRHAQQCADTWASYIEQCPENLKLGLVYVANEVVQQAKIKQKDVFVDSWAQVLPATIGKVYSDVPSQIQDRITRVVKVWKDRKVFSPQTLGEIEAQLGGSGGAFFSSGSNPSGAPASGAVHPDLATLIKTYSKIQTFRPPKITPAMTPAEIQTAQATVKASLQTATGQLDAAKSALDQLEALTAKLESRKSSLEANVTSLNDILLGLDAQLADNDEEPSPAIEDDSEPEIYTANDVDDIEEVEEEPSKRQKVDLDPKLMSFLASMK